MTLKDFMNKITHKYEDIKNTQFHNSQSPGVYNIPDQQPQQQFIHGQYNSPRPGVYNVPGQQGYDVTSIPGSFGDGIHDDTKAVSRYLNSGDESLIYRLPPGNYLITEPIEIKRNNIQIIGCENVRILGNLSIWREQPVSQGYINLKEYLFIISGDNVIIDSLNVTCLLQSSLSASFLYYKGNNFKMINCQIDDFNQGLCMGILTDCSGNIPPNSHFYDVEITLNKITNIKGHIDGSVCYGDGIAFFGFSNVVISNNLITAKDGWKPRNGLNSGPEGFEPSTNVKFTNNKIRGNWDYSLTTEGGNQCVISNNDIEGAPIWAIIERGKDIKVIGNKINITSPVNKGDNRIPSAINFYGVHTGEIHNNVITTSDNSTCNYGILIKPSHETAGGTNTLIENNTINGNFINGIMFSDANNGKIYNNYLNSTHSDGDSIGLQLWYSCELDVENNQINFINGTACRCSGMKNVKITSNNMMSSKYGVQIYHDSHHVTINNNDLSNISQNKIDKSDNCTVSALNNYGIDINTTPSNNNNNNNNNTLPNLKK